MDNICKICDQPVTEEKHFWKVHHLKREDYYKRYYPKKDLLTGEEIPFKSVEQYLFSDFANKKNLASWVKKNPDKAPEYCKNLLIQRKEKKNLIYSLSQVELKTLPMPSIPTYESLLGDYYNLCESLGFKNKYRKLKENLDFVPTDYTVQTDTREQREIIFEDKETIHSKLDFGDYLLRSESNYVYFERKTLADLIGTCSTGYERFKKELQRAQDANEHLIIICEEKLQNLLSFNYLPHISRKIKVTPDYIAHNIRELIQEFSKMQFVFCDGRIKTKETMEKILWMGLIYKNLDLQLLMDERII